jgi:hypothetical protein
LLHLKGRHAARVQVLQLRAEGQLWPPQHGRDDKLERKPRAIRRAWLRPAVAGVQGKGVVAASEGKPTQALATSAGERLQLEVQRERVCVCVCVCECGGAREELAPSPDQSPRRTADGCRARRSQKYSGCTVEQGREGE